MPSPENVDARIGTTLLGKLQVVRRIGGGGMGEVYEVEHLLTRHRRALKVVRAELAQERRFMERFLREVSIAGRLGTPFVAETFDAGWLEDESAYLLMELLTGQSLHALLEKDGMLSERRAATLMCQVAEGAQVAHEASIVHRDLKPENVFITMTEDGRERVKILDFGVSKFLDVSDEKATKLTREGSSVGTPYYMAPEQAAGKQVDARADVWAMGVMLYELVTGRLPFDGETVGEVFLKIGGGNYVPLEHRRPDLDPAFIAVVERALQGDLTQRYPTAEAMRRDLLRFAGGEPAARAKTISDGPVNGPLGVVPPPMSLPKPPAVPTFTPDLSKAEMRVATPRSQSPMKAPIVDAPKPQATPSGARRAIAAAAMLLIVVAVSIAVFGTDEPVSAPTVAPTLETVEALPADTTPIAAEPEVVAAPPSPPIIDTTPPVPPESTHVRTTPRTRAEAAGLEGDPYER